MPPMGLQARFKDVMDTFNSLSITNLGAYDELVLKMDANVILKKVLHPGSIVGVGNAKGYLDAHMKPLFPKFNVDLLKVTTRFLVGASENDATYGQVYGPATYVDQNSTSTTNIFFIHSFIRNDASEEWSLSDAFAYRTS
jgi:hypothetical protein